MATFPEPPSFLKLIAHELRWKLMEALVRSDRRYSLDLERQRGLYLAAGETLHPGLAAGPRPAAETSRRRKGPLRVLFLRTHNSARSQMAEAILRQLGAGKVDVQSAGTEATRVPPRSGWQGRSGLRRPAEFL